MSDFFRSLEENHRRAELHARMHGLSAADLLLFLLDADTVARTRGDRVGLCDALDAHLQPYPGAGLAEILRVARDGGVRSTVSLTADARHDDAVNEVLRRAEAERAAIPV